MMNRPLRCSIVCRYVVLLCLGLLIFMVDEGVVSAQTLHAKVLSAVPAIGSTITQVPTTVTVECAENINPDPKLSNLFVYSPAGELISQGNATVSLNKPMEMSVSLKPGGNGIYVVRWITVSALDGDPDQGAFGFTVKSATTTTTTPATANGTPSATSGSSGTPVWVTVLVGVIALLVGLGFGLVLNRRKAKSSSFSSLREDIAKSRNPPGADKPASTAG